MTEYWMLTWPTAGRTVQVAKLCEATGWDGLLVTDTQCLAAEAIVQLSLCVAATQRIRLGTGVTNPITRDPVRARIGIRDAAAGIGRTHVARHRPRRFVARAHRPNPCVGVGARGLRHSPAEISARRVGRPRRVCESPARARRTTRCRSSIRSSTKGSARHRRHRQARHRVGRAACRRTDARRRRERRAHRRKGARSGTRHWPPPAGRVANSRSARTSTSQSTIASRSPETRCAAAWR